MFLGISKQNWKKIDFGIEEFLLLTIVILNIFDGFELINSDWDYIKKIISWSALGLLFYKIKISKIFTGKEDKKIDILLIAGYFLLIIKNLISYAFVSINDASSFLIPFYEFLITNYKSIELTSIYLGFIFIIFASLYFTFDGTIKKNSILYHLKEKTKKEKNLTNQGKNFVAFFIVSILFFIGVFNLVMEWLAISIDAPLLITGLVIYFFFILKQRNKFRIGSFLNKFGNYGSGFYEFLIEHLKYKKKLILIVGGILTLHVFTDVFNYIWPYIFKVFDPLYLSLMQNNHEPIINLFFQNVAESTMISFTLTLMVYIFNIIAIIFLLTYSTYIWYLMYKRKRLERTKFFNSFILISLIFAVFYPLFKIKMLSINGLYGVDIQTNYVVVKNIFWPILFSLIGIYLIHEKKKNYNIVINKLLIFVSQLFFIYYIILYFISISQYYITVILDFIEINNYILYILFIILFCATFLLYAIGLIGFEYHVGEYLINYHKIEPTKTKKKKLNKNRILVKRRIYSKNK